MPISSVKQIENYKLTNSSGKKEAISSSEGLYIHFSQTKKGVAKKWRIRIGNSFISFASFPNLSLAEARALQGHAKDLLDRGTNKDLVLAALKEASVLPNPTTAEMDAILNQSTKPTTLTFGEVWEQWYKIKLNIWKGKEPKDQKSIFRDYMGTLADRPINEITKPELHKLLLPVFQTKWHRAKRLRLAIKGVFDYAVDYLNAVENSPVPGHDLYKAMKPKSKPHGTCELEQLPNIVKTCFTGQHPMVNKLCLLLTLVTAHRFNVMRWGMWEHYDENTNAWTIPEKLRDSNEVGTKSSRSFKQWCPPLLMQRIKELNPDSPYFFPWPGSVNPVISENSVTNMLKDFYPGLTIHGVARNSAMVFGMTQGYESWVCHSFLDHAPSANHPLDPSYARDPNMYWDKRKELAQEYWPFIISKLDGWS